MDLEKSVQSFYGNLNAKGVPVPLVRDPKTGTGSITATTFIMSALLCLICALAALGSAVAKFGHVFDSFADSQQAIMNAFSVSFQFFVASGGFYLGRRFGKDGNKVTSDAPDAGGKDQNG